MALAGACNPHEEKAVEPMGKPISELAAIDSLMWRQPDSALTVMLEFAGSDVADSLDEFNGHYCQLLISELLYKNDWKQSNRENLLKAVDYFDLLVITEARGASEHERNVFLDARAHYINGVGFYERGDAVNACAEYLKTLEVMEEHFKEQELVGHKARFLAYTYNRLGDLFSEQFMMESSITCYENALVYCKIEPTSPIGVSNILYRIGKQYDKKNEIEKAISYYSEALENMTETDNMVYRDIVTSKALFDYKTGVAAEVSLDKIRRVLLQAETDKERLHRYLAIGGVYFYESNYDSALYYLEPVFENREAGLQDQAANYLYIVYDKLGDKEQSDSLVHYMTSRKKLVGENKALVSRLEDMYKTHMIQEQEKQAETERQKAVRRVRNIIVPIAVVVVLVVICALMLRNKKQLKIQQEEADRILDETELEHEKTKKRYEEELRQLKAETEQRLEEAERKHQQWMAEASERHEEELRTQKDLSEKEIEKTKKRHVKELEAERNAYQKEREELERSLQQSKENVSALQEELGRKRTGAAEHYAAFLEDPVCTKINALVRDLHITTRKPYSHYHISLDNETIAQLSEAVTAHYGELKPALQCHYPGIGHEDLLLCYLYLLGLNNKQIAVLRQRDYFTVRKQAKELMGKLRIDETVREYVLRVGGIEGAAIE